tara:strand:+ start:5394 stop:5864 length:471 start_codon:yes stop_codon:yes gene_type:complete
MTMSLIKWIPNNVELSPIVSTSMLNDIDQFINSFFNETFNYNSIADAKWLPAFDVIEKEKMYEIRVEAPGMGKNEFEVTVQDGVITIAGEKKTASNNKKDGYTYRESSEGRFSRSFRLPEAVNEKKVTASYNNGVLNISIPRSKPIEVKKLEIEVK